MPCDSPALTLAKSATTRVLGVIGNPISHSRSPLLHNAALAASGEDVVYVPLLVENARDFLANPLFQRRDFAGFSVTIPHKETVLQCCGEVRAGSRLPWPVNDPPRRSMPWRRASAPSIRC